MKNLICTCLFVLALNAANAQYKTAVGIRFSDGPAVTAKFNFDSNKAIEALLGGFGNGLKGTVLYEIHNTAFGTPQWRWYYGFGGHMGSTPVKRKYYDEFDPFFHVGADGILGIEYTFKEIPVNISGDWKPEFNFVEHTGLVLPLFGFSGRLAF